MILYSNKIITNEINSCKKHKQACQRFLNDLDKENFDYIFDESKAEHFIKWCKQFKHRKGILAGKYIEPVEIQKFIFGNIYGWIHKKTKLRRFNKAYWQVGRKNAKSQSLALVGSYELAVKGVESSEVYSVATKKEQAMIVWQDCQKMIMNSKFKKKFRVAYNTLFHDKSDSFFKTLSKDDKDSGDGLNCQCGIVDEYHAHKTDEYYEILESGMVARKEPLMIIITTAGFELNNPCYSIEYKYVSNILNPNVEIENDKYFIMINELEKNENGDIIDDIMDSSTYIKANPIVATYQEGLENLISRAKVASESTEKLRKFLTKNMNIWVNMSESKYLIDEKWNKCIIDERIETITNKKVYIGVDLSSTIDITSVGIVWFENNILKIGSMSFIPENSIMSKIKRDNVRYDKWIEDGYLVATPGEEVDYYFVKDWLMNFIKNQNNEIEEICYDKWNAQMFSQAMRNEGATVVDIGQNYSNLSEATKKLRALIYNNKVTIYYNPVLNFAVNNAIEKMDMQGNIMLDKAKSIKRIDPLASIINACNRAFYNYNIENELEVVII